MSSIDPINPQTPPTGATNPTGAAGSQSPAPFFPPDAKKLSPSDPWYKMMQKLFPSTPPDQLGVYAAQFEKNILNSINNTINKLQQKQHETAEQVKRMMLGED